MEDLRYRVQSAVFIFLFMTISFFFLTYNMYVISEQRLVHLNQAAATAEMSEDIAINLAAMVTEYSSVITEPDLLTMMQQAAADAKVSLIDDLVTYNEYLTDLQSGASDSSSSVYTKFYDWKVPTLTLNINNTCTHTLDTLQFNSLQMGQYVADHASEIAAQDIDYSNSDLYTSERAFEVIYNTHNTYVLSL